MSINTREMLLIIRASDQASRIISGVGNSFSSLEGKQKAAAMASIQQGQALVSIGVAIAAVGIAGIAFYTGTAKAASAYNKEAALTLTQVDKVGVSLKTIKQIGIDVAKAIPAPFEQMQKTLYDIFSSMDVGPREAKILLTEFAKAAVAGNVDVQTAGRATIAILNGFKLPVSEVSRVMDVQFQLVRKGVGTYQEFASSIGRVIPSAVRAGQSVETMAGMLAFLTRNGLSAAMASTSAARAMDAISNPKTVARLEEMGIKVKNIHGEFLPLVEVLGQMNTKFKDLTGPERAKALQDLFKGSGGTIQARRFFDPVFKNFDEFSKRVGEMQHSTGSLGKAYEIMASQSAAKAQAFSNAWHILKVEIGDKFLPIGAKLIEFMTHLINIFDSIPGPVKTVIVLFGAILSVVMAVSGVVIALVGGFQILMGTLALMGIELSAILIPAGLIVAAILAIVVIGYLLITHWNTLKDIAGTVWDFIKEKALGFWQSIQGILNWFQSTFGPGFAEVWNAVASSASQLWVALKETWDAIVGYIQPLVSGFLQIISAYFTTSFEIIKAIVSGGLALIQSFWDHFGSTIMELVRIAWTGIVGIIRGVLDIITGTIKFVLAVIRGDWGAAWDAIKQVLSGALNAILTAIAGTFLLVGTAFKGLVTGLPGFFGDAAKILFGVGEKIIQGLINGIKGAIGGVKNVLVGLGKDMVSWKGPPSHDAVMLFNNGQLIMQGLNKGIQNQVPKLKSLLGDISDLIQIKYGSTQGTLDAIANAATGASSSVAGSTGTGGVNITFAEGSFPVNIDGAGGLDMNAVQQIISARNEQLIRQLKQALGS